MLLNYGGCAVNLRTTSNSVDVSNWTYDILVENDQRILYLKQYVGNEVNISAPVIVP